MQPNIPTAQNNPGDIKQNGQIATYSSPAEGQAALYNDLTAKMTGTSTTGLNGQSSLYDFAKTYAPASDGNNPAQYAAKLANQMGVSPDTPIGTLIPRIDDFAKAVSTNEGYMSQLGETPKPQDQSLGQELGGRLSGIGSNISDLASYASGKGSTQNPLSDVLQAAGGVAGGIGDVVNKGLELVPGVKWLENEAGIGIGKLAQTPVGQSVVNSLQSFSQAHPELSADIGAGFNIATAIPILKGLGVVADAASSGIGAALRGVAEKGFMNDITDPLARTISGRDLLAGKDFEGIVKDGIIKPGNIPDIINVDGVPKYDSTEAIAKSNAQIKAIDQNELQPELEKAQQIISQSHESEGLTPPTLSSIQASALENAKNALQNDAPVKSIFEKIQAKYGDFPTLADLNNAKRDVSNLISESAFGSPDYSALKNVRSELQVAVEKGAKDLGLKDVGAINAKMRRLYQAQDILDGLNGKKVRIGLGSKLLRKGVSVGAGMLGSSLGGGTIGGIGAGLLTDTADKGIQGLGSKIRNSILQKGASESGSIIPKVLKGSAGLLGGALVQKANR